MNWGEDIRRRMGQDRGRYIVEVEGRGGRVDESDER